MNVGFYLTGNIPAWADLMVQSIRTHMPNVPIFQLTDETSSTVKGIDGVMRLPAAPLSMHRATHFANVRGHWLFIDTDVMLQRDVSDVFANWSFDVALADRNWTLYHGKERAGGQKSYAERYPFNAGVAFSTGPSFWSEIVRYLLIHRELQVSIMGDQYAMGQVASLKRGQFKVKVLPGMIYNFPPEAADDPDIQHAAIVHFKGKHRKPFLMERAKVCA